MKIFGCLLLFSCLGVMAQYKVSPNLVKGYSYENYPFPDGIKVYRMNKEKVVLKTTGLTLIEVWASDSGTERPVWEKVRTWSAVYGKEGLKTISVNFENGSSFKYQHAYLKEYFSKVPEPEEFYFDAMGYIIDFLKVPGFPAYYLVDDKGMIVFRTNGKDSEGLNLMEEEIISRLK